MQTHTITTYQFAKLSEEAQQKAHEEYITSGNFEYFWLDEGLDSVKAFCALFGVKVTDYSLSTYSYSYIKTNATQETFRNIGKHFIIPEFITGYCADEDLRLVYNDTFRATGSAKRAFEAAIESAKKDIIADMEYQESFEYFTETAEGNEWQFTEKGNFY